ncbi:Galactose-1-phosphate uridylyltransferase [Pirellulimonas nuda]|uniref:Galactose-1-phosphate uridylyltransferase n=1 Tax=Pirellulimonas nuda TaxID=2528009 RepID=A0A518D641_9BACT|nr:DUF4931 domain-containing protein [Pirellulimonas nuda]QDU86929.1 Galactose-1-phosphate uridylyltransferase [Pirellulimonas nuda]
MGPQRDDPLTGRRTLLAESRAGRPNDLDPASGAGPTGEGCPFCAGAEHRTPDPFDQLLAGDGAWLARAIPNKYPAVGQPEQGLAPGLHEVLIESPRHIDRVGQMTPRELRAALTLAGRRLQAAADDDRFAYRLVFKNQGRSAGASLGHVHSQLIALEELPGLVVEEVGRAERFFRDHGHCATCDLIERERAAGVRVVAQTERLIALCPAAGRQPCETWVMPRGHAPRFEQWVAEADALLELSDMLGRLVPLIEAAIAPHGLNWLVQTQPGGVSDAAYHWRLEIVPRVGSLAGAELATGLGLNVLAPEIATQRLRAALQEQAQ